MIDWSYIIARLISAIGSWIEASNLRNRVYKLAEENEIMMTALEDIARMDREGAMGKYAKQTINQVRDLPLDQVDQ
jgi:predicted KAP-like P-loop ATPase